MSKMCIGQCESLFTAVSPESSNIDILDQLRWSPWKEKDGLRDYVEEKGGGPFSWSGAVWVEER
jgi:hypothetical protein